jgi:hypothetical protein
LSVGARSERSHLDFVPGALVFEVLEPPLASPWLEELGGLVAVPAEWTVPVRCADEARSVPGIS